MTDSKKLLKIYDLLYSQHGPQNWWPGETQIEIIVGAILTQNVSWSNASKAVNRLKKMSLLDPEKLWKISNPDLARLITESRFYNQKAEKIKNFIQFLYDHYSGNLEFMFEEETEILRKKLLEIKGIGKETADSILLYGGNKTVFVSDAYTKRIFTRIGVISEEYNYDMIQNYFMSRLPNDSLIYNEFHALVVQHGNKICRNKPLCTACILKDGSTICKY